MDPRVAGQLRMEGRGQEGTLPDRDDPTGALVRAEDLDIGAGLPAFGSCAGMIMLADRLVDGVDGQQTFGGIDMTARRNAFGRQVDSFEREVALRLDDGTAGDDGDGAPFHAVFIRAPWVEQAGEEVTVLGEDNGRIVAVRRGPLLATAFHPELTQDRRIHELFVKMVKGTS